MQVSVLAQNGFSSSVSVSLGTLPDGVTVSPASLSVSPGAPQNFTFAASASAVVEQGSVSVNGTSGFLSSSATLDLSVNGTAVPDPFHPVGGALVHGFYDESRNLLFATNPGLNELDVFSGQTFSLTARIPVPQPWGIDQMADGNTLVIGTAAQEIVTVDENTFAVTQHPFSAAGTGGVSLFFPNVVAMANGEVLMIGQEEGVDSNDILDGGQYLYEWDSIANTFTQLEPSAQSQTVGWETDSLARSADHEWAVFAADQFYLYSSSSDSLTSVPLSAVNPPDNSYGVRGYAINADGTEIAVASTYQVTFLNRSLAVLGTTPIPGAFQTGRTAVQFSADGQKLFLQYPLPLIIEEIDANTYTALGYLSGDVEPGGDNLERLLATDSSGHGYVGIDGGLRIVNMAQPLVPNPNPLSTTPGVPACPELDAILPLNTTQDASVLNLPSGVSFYVGGQPAPVINGGTSVSIPASSTPGPADIECVDASGDTEVATEGVSYGVDPVGFGANLLPPSGNPISYLFGFGFYPGSQLNYQTNPPFTGSLLVGSQPASNPTQIGAVWSGTTQEGLTFQVPGGSPGETVGVNVSSSLGNGSLSSVATYYPAANIIPASGLLQLLYDTHRNLLYALKSNEVAVLNPSTLQWQSPITFPSNAPGTYDTMELTPDGSELVVAGMAGTEPQLLVLDPDGVVAPAVFTYTGYTNGSGYGSIAITADNQVLMPGDPDLLFDLSTSTFSTNLALPVLSGSVVVRASADGSHVYEAQLNDSGGEVSTLDPSTLSVQSESFGYLFWTDLAVSPDGSQFAAVDTPTGFAGDAIGFFDSNLHYLNTNVYPRFSPPDAPGFPGATFSPGGKVLVVPLGDSIELWDASQGTLMERVLTPESLQAASPDSAVSPMMALDSTGQTIFAISQSGLTVITLPAPMDQMSPMQWPPVASAARAESGFGVTIVSHMAALHARLQK